MIQFIFVDLDGTFLNSDKQVTVESLKTIQKIKKEYSVQFGIASGRALTSLIPMLKEQNLENIVDVIVANNGAEILDVHTKNTKYLPFVEPSVLNDVLTTFQHWPKMTVCFHNPNIFYATRKTDRILHIQKMNHEDHLLDPLKNQSFGASARIMLILDSPVYETYIEKIRNVRFPNLKGYRSEKDIYEFMHRETSKEKGIEAYVKQWGCSLEDVMSFGDSENDKEMIRECGWGVAMKNAKRSIQNIANDQTAFTNDENGVVEYLLQHTDMFLERIED